jgi:hypothetical protein
VEVEEEESGAEDRSRKKNGAENEEEEKEGTRIGGRGERCRRECNSGAESRGCVGKRQ